MKQKSYSVAPRSRMDGHDQEMKSMKDRLRNHSFKFGYEKSTKEEDIIHTNVPAILSVKNKKSTRAHRNKISQKMTSICVYDKSKKLVRLLCLTLHRLILKISLKKKTIQRL